MSHQEHLHRTRGKSSQQVSCIKPAPSALTDPRRAFHYSDLLTRQIYCRTIVADHRDLNDPDVTPLFTKDLLRHRGVRSRSFALACMTFTALSPSHHSPGVLSELLRTKSPKTMLFSHRGVRWGSLQHSRTTQNAHGDHTTDSFRKLQSHLSSYPQCENVRRQQSLLAFVTASVSCQRRSPFARLLGLCLVAHRHYFASARTHPSPRSRFLGVSGVSVRVVRSQSARLFRDSPGSRAHAC